MFAYSSKAFAWIYWWIRLFILITLMSHVRCQESNNTEVKDYEIYYGEEPDPPPPDYENQMMPPTTTQITFPPTTTPIVEVPTTTVPDLRPIIDQVDRSCCAIPALDCSMVNQQAMGASNDVGAGVSFSDAQDPFDATLLITDNNNMIRGKMTNITRVRRQASLNEQYIDQLGINLLRFESCLCQANIAPSACRMLFPPGFYTPSKPGLFDVTFNGDLVTKRFRCSFYSGNIVDCLYQSRVSYSPLSAPVVHFLVNDKAELSGTQCIICNSFYCTFDVFKRRSEGTANLPFNQDFAQCVANRSGAPLPTKTTTTPRPFWTGPPLPSSDLMLEDYQQPTSALWQLSLITKKGILLGLGRHGGNTTLAERYNIATPLHSGLHPLLEHGDDHDDHAHDGYIIALSVIVGLFIGAFIVGLIIFILYRRRKTTGKLTERSLRGLPIVKLDVIDPSPFSGVSGGGSEYEYKSGVSDISRSSGSVYAMTAGSTDSMKYNGDGAPPVARVIPVPKTAKRTVKQPLPVIPTSRGTRTSNTSHDDGSRFRGSSTSSSPSNRSRQLRIHEDRDNNSVFSSQRPEIRARNVPSSSTKSNASSVHIYSKMGKRPRVPPRSPNVKNLRKSSNSSPMNSRANNNSLDKPKIIPRSPKNLPRRPENHTRTPSNISSHSGISSFHNTGSGNNNLFHRPSLDAAMSDHSNVNHRRSNIPSVSSSRGSRGIQGFYYDVDEEENDYNDIYASIDEAGEVEMEMEPEEEEPRRKGHSRYETRICRSEDMTDAVFEDPVVVRVEQSGQYEVPVRSALLNDPPRPVKPARMTVPVNNTIPSSIAPPVPQRSRHSSSSSDSSRSSCSRGSKYDDQSHFENEYTMIRDDLVQTSYA